MTNAKQRIAIAEATGKMVRSAGFTNNDIIKNGIVDDLPDYPNDLNAMHEVEKVLTSIQYWTFVEWVRVTVQDKHVDYVAHPTSATAAQRAEAFLRTIGKWDDSK